MQKTDEEWKRELTPEQYHVLREKGTEAPGSGVFLDNVKEGDYVCAGCSNLVFRSDTKHESTTPGLIGWPAFSEMAEEGAVELKVDDSFGMTRLEVVCSNCGGHLGHFFEDPSSPNCKHYCINSCALDFEEK